VTHCTCGDPRDEHASDHGPCLFGVVISDRMHFCPCKHFTPDDGVERECSPTVCSVAALAIMDAALPRRGTFAADGTYLLDDGPLHRFQDRFLPPSPPQKVKKERR
jgi:hypothetical protein